MSTLSSPKATRDRVADIASACSRIGTWGMDPEFRAQLLAERQADLEAQSADPKHNSIPSVLGRAVRTLIGDILGRLGSTHASALPLAIACLVAGAGTMLYLAVQPLPGYRLSLFLNGLGFLVLGMTSLRSPLRIRRTPSAIGALMIAAGSAIGVRVIPFDPDVGLFYYTAMAALSLASIGFSLLALGLVAKWSRAPHVSATVLFGAGGLLAFSEVGWAVFMFRQSITEFLAAVLTATGALLFIRFFGRLRDLPIESRRRGPASTAGQ